MLDVNTFFFNNAQTIEESSEIVDSSIFEAIGSCARINNQTYLVIDFDKHKPVFMTDNLIYLDEATPADRKRYSPNPYWALINEDVLEPLIRMKDNYIKLRSMMKEEEYRSHLCVVDYPISIKGRDFYINSRYTPALLRSDGHSHLGLFSVAPSCRRSLTSIVISDSGRRWTYDFEHDEFRSYELGIKLSLAERAVLQRAKKGMTNEEIADDLFLSVNTVKSHKMHIFKKLNVESITEALLIVGNYRLL
ncbi:MAG: helix-turn-helix transcriptional regulator [Bacteroidales bacterium]|nr:helix-turn-helix transcriptional regulator [Bacteroidales bacterium]